MYGLLFITESRKFIGTKYVMSRRHTWQQFFSFAISMQICVCLHAPLALPRTLHLKDVKGLVVNLQAAPNFDLIMRT